MGKPITATSLEPYRQAGIVAAARALRRSTRTINRDAQRLGFVFGTNCSAVESDRRREQRKALAPVVIILAALGLSQERMCGHLKVGRHTLRRIASEHRICINSRQAECQE